MKNIGIYFSKSGKMSYPFDIVEYYESYQELISIIESDKNVKVFIVRGKSYKGKGVFSEAYYFENQKLIQAKEIKVDLIFNRCDLHEINDCKVINSPSFYELCEDKYDTFLQFPNISTKTKYIHNYNELSKAAGSLKIKNNELIVLKKNFSSGGKDIHITTLKSVHNDLYTDWTDILVQTFIDSSIGIKGIVEGLHDLRVMIVNHNIIGATIRTPKEGSYLANVAQGGTSVTLDVEHLPQDLLDVLDQVVRKLNNYEDIVYGADFMNSPDGYKLVELNACPGLLHKNWDKNCLHFYNAISVMLLEAIKKV